MFPDRTHTTPSSGESKSLDAQLQQSGRLQKVASAIDAYLGVESFIHADHRGILPVFGFLAAQTKTPESMYRFLPDTSCVATLLKSLFYRADGVEFEPSKRFDQVSRYLSPFSIGVLVGTLTREDASACLSDGRVYDALLSDASFIEAIARQDRRHGIAEEIAAKSVSIFRDGEDEVRRLQEESKEDKTSIGKAQSRINSIIDRALAGLPKVERTEIRGRIRTADRVSDEGPDLAEREIVGVVNKHLPDRGEEVSTLCSQVRTLRARTVSLPRRIEEVRKTVSHRIQDSLSDYGSTDAQSFISTIKLNEGGVGRYFDKYITSLAARLDPSSVIDKALPELLDNLREAADQALAPLATNILLLLLSYKTTGKEDIQEYLKGLKSSNPEVFITNDGEASSNEVESSAFEVFKRVRLESTLPPLASTKIVNIIVGGETVIFPDCGETTVRNILNAFLYDPVTQQYSSEKLERADLAVDPAVVTFYKRNATASSTCAQKVHDEWAALLAERPGIAYMTPYASPRCEITAGARSFCDVLSSLTGEPSIDQLFHKLMPHSQIASFDLSSFSEEEDREDFANKIILSTSGNKTLEIYLLKKHYRVYEKSEEHVVEHDRLRIESAFEHLVPHVGPIKALTVLGPHLNKIPVGEVTSLALFDRLSSEEKLNAILSSRLDWMEDVFDVGMAIMRHIPLTQESHQTEVAKKVLLSISQFDGHQKWRDKAADFIENNGIHALSRTAQQLRHGTLDERFIERDAAR